MGIGKVEQGGLRPIKNTVAKGKGTTFEAKVEAKAQKDESSWERGDIVKIYSSPHEFFEDLLKDIRNAKKRVYITDFIIEKESKDEISRKLVEALKAAKARGVDVVLRTDRVSLSILHAFDTFFDLKESGIPVQVAPTTSLKRLVSKGSFIESDHRKVFVIDDKAYVGGVCIKDLWYNNDYRDIMVAVKGDIVKDITKNVMSTWEGRRYVHIPTKGGTLKMRLIYTHGGDMEFKKTVLNLIKNAKKEIFIENQYFVDEDIAKALLEAQKRGVQVKLIVPKNKDDIANDLFYIPISKLLTEDLVKAGAEVWRYKGGKKQYLLHTKLMVVDGRYTIVGSHNFDYLSTERSHELSLLIDSPEVAKKFIAHMNESIKMSEKETRITGLKRLWAKVAKLLVDIGPIGPIHKTGLSKWLEKLDKHVEEDRVGVQLGWFDKIISVLVGERGF